MIKEISNILKLIFKILHMHEILKIQEKQTVAKQKENEKHHSLYHLIFTSIFKGSDLPFFSWPSARPQRCRNQTPSVGETRDQTRAYEGSVRRAKAVIYIYIFIYIGTTVFIFLSKECTHLKSFQFFLLESLGIRRPVVQGHMASTHAKIA